MMSLLHIYRCDYDGFEGTCIGHYVTREGKFGRVLQQIGTKVVHVYRNDRLTVVEQSGECAKRETNTK